MRLRSLCFGRVWRRWFGKVDLNQPLNRVDRATELDPQTCQQREAEGKLNEYDRGERHSALPRSHRS